MKIAKKVLAVVITVAMLACFSAVAFAAPAEGAQLKLVLGEVNKKGYYPVTLVAENSIGLAAADVTLSYDESVVAYVSSADGKDAKQVAAAIDKEANTFNSAINGAAAGEVAYAFNFLENLWATEEWDANTNMDWEEESAGINANAFEVAVFYFELAEGKTADDIAIALSAVVTLETEEKIADYPCVGIEAKDPPVPPTDPTDPTDPDDPTDPTDPDDPTDPTDPTDPDDPTDPTEKPTGDDTTGDDKPAGDIGLLAVAAGVVAVAGAAFVVSKKRK